MQRSQRLMKEIKIQQAQHRTNIRAMVLYLKVKLLVLFSVYSNTVPELLCPFHSLLLNINSANGF